MPIVFSIVYALWESILMKIILLSYICILEFMVLATNASVLTIKSMSHKPMNIKN
jgi:hypothetical protein